MHKFRHTHTYTVVPWYSWASKQRCRPL